MRNTLKTIWRENYENIMSYPTFRKYVFEKLEELKPYILVKNNKERTTIKILDTVKFLETFKS